MKKSIIIAMVILLVAVAAILLVSQDQKQAPASDFYAATLNSDLPNQTDQNLANNQESMNISSSQGPSALPPEFENASQAVIKTSLGDITVELYRDDAPQTTRNFLALAASGFYDGVKFHRVIENFMVQAGDPLSKDNLSKSMWGTGGPGYMFADEINEHKLVKGSLAMANAGPDTNGSQFFIVTADSTSWLDGKHTNFGQVIAGLEVVEAISQVATEGPDRPISDVVILSIDLK